MPPIRHDDKAVSQSCPSPFRPSATAPLIPWEDSWALSGCITWRHLDRPLLTIPFLYTPTPFLPGATTIPDPLPNQSIHPASRELDSKRSTLPDLPLQDDWVVVDGRWHYQMLGWREREERVGPYSRKVKYAVAVSGLAIDVGNLMLDPEDIGNIRLLHFLYRHFRPAGVIHDIWVPAGQEGKDDLKAVVMFKREFEVRHALLIPDKEFFFDGIARTISVDRHETRDWYPAPRSRVKTLQEHALKTKETCIKSLITLDPFLGTIRTNRYSGGKASEEPPCFYRHLNKMPEKYHPRLHIGLDGFDPIDSSVDSTLPDTRATPPPCRGSDPHIPRAMLDCKDLSIRPPRPSVPVGSPVFDTIGRLTTIVGPLSTARHRLDTEKDTDLPCESHPAKRQKMFSTEEGFANQSRENVLSDVGLIPKGRTKGETLTEMAKARTTRLQAGMGIIHNARKRKAGELDTDEESESGSDMDMDIDE